ncbi:tautomerase PptA [Paracoccus aurantiacus]|uniref:Tautomerase PptA n=1 Tax=Paracoccus aurantiacus TaxID=2599412 RepID=A0A5C6SBE6_9RHOB|nr:tautomerase PptA [Paracoccus aurantiacus]TXB71133.1 tautomerase PptA [Paracoccus aurantiacus]
MPHVIVKCWPGQTEEQKQQLADAITRDVMKFLGSGAGSISVAIEDVESADWKAQVYDPEIKPRLAKLYKKPGYEM